MNFPGMSLEASGIPKSPGTPLGGSQEGRLDPPGSLTEALVERLPNLPLLRAGNVVPKYPRVRLNLKKILFCFLCVKCPEGVLIFYMPGNFRTRAHSEKWDMAFDSKMPCVVLKSLDGHETSRQATDLDENFGTPYSF